MIFKLAGWECVGCGKYACTCSRCSKFDTEGVNP